MDAGAWNSRTAPREDVLAIALGAPSLPKAASLTEHSAGPSSCVTPLVMSLSNRFTYVVAAAVAAALGDLLMLYVVADAQLAGGLVRPPGVTLVVGAMLGVVGIPFYWFGYWLLARAMTPSHPVAARVVMCCGALIGSIGGLIHAVTAFGIRFQMIAGDPPLPPAEWVAHGGTLLSVAWIVVVAAAVTAGAVFAWVALAADTAFPRLLGLFNPVVLTVAIGLAGLGSAVGHAFIIPAAPNIAHVVFFSLAALLAGSSDARAWR